MKKLGDVVRALVALFVLAVLGLLVGAFAWSVLTNVVVWKLLGAAVAVFAVGLLWAEVRERPTR